MTSGNYPQTKDGFVNYLEDNGALEAFEEEYQHGAFEDNPDTWEEFLEVTSPDEFLENAFSWGDTDDGFDYWDELNMDWIYMA